jgi:hypothetical protein
MKILQCKLRAFLTDDHGRGSKPVIVSTVIVAIMGVVKQCNVANGWRLGGIKYTSTAAEIV